MIDLQFETTDGNIWQLDFDKMLWYRASSIADADGNLQTLEEGKLDAFGFGQFKMVGRNPKPKSESEPGTEQRGKDLIGLDVIGVITTPVISGKSTQFIRANVTIKNVKIPAGVQEVRVEEVNDTLPAQRPPEQMPPAPVNLNEAVEEDHAHDVARMADEGCPHHE